MKSIAIDSSKIDEVGISLVTDEKTITEKKQARNIKGSQVILQTIDQLLKKEGYRIKQLDKVVVHSGPGSYTGLRVGAAIGNTIAFCLHIPINNKQVGEFVYPSYE